jgi:carbonic anhydrase
MSHHPIAAAEALARLKEGNARFADDARPTDALVSEARRRSLVQGQAPFAIVLSCSDSRAPSEIVFDCGLGELFVVRVAGNVVAPSIVGSVEFAAATFGTPLVVVMGHSGCGAVRATVSHFTEGQKAASPNIMDIVGRIAPAVRELAPPGASTLDVLPAAIRANVRASVNQLRHGSALLERLVGDGQLAVVGAEYSLETGLVTFLDQPG